MPGLLQRQIERLLQRELTRLKREGHIEEVQNPFIKDGIAQEEPQKLFKETLSKAFQQNIPTIIPINTTRQRITKYDMEQGIPWTALLIIPKIMPDNKELYIYYLDSSGIYSVENEQNTDLVILKMNRPNIPYSLRDEVKQIIYCIDLFARQTELPINFLSSALKQHEYEDKKKFGPYVIQNTLDILFSSESYSERLASLRRGLDQQYADLIRDGDAARQQMSRPLPDGINRRSLLELLLKENFLTPTKIREAHPQGLYNLVALVGEVGVGKSTLTNVLQGFTIVPTEDDESIVDVISSNGERIVDGIAQILPSWEAGSGTKIHGLYKIREEEITLIDSPGRDHLGDSTYEYRIAQALQMQVLMHEGKLSGTEDKDLRGFKAIIHVFNLARIQRTGNFFENIEQLVRVYNNLELDKIQFVVTHIHVKNPRKHFETALKNIIAYQYKELYGTDENDEVFISTNAWYEIQNNDLARFEKLLEEKENLNTRFVKLTMVQNQLKKIEAELRQALSDANANKINELNRQKTDLEQQEKQDLNFSQQRLQAIKFLELVLQSGMDNVHFFSWKCDDTREDLIRNQSILRQKLFERIRRSSGILLSDMNVFNPSVRDEDNILLKKTEGFIAHILDEISPHVYELSKYQEALESEELKMSNIERFHLEQFFLPCIELAERNNLKELEILLEKMEQHLPLLTVHREFYYQVFARLHNYLSFYESDAPFQLWSDGSCLYESTRSGLVNEQSSGVVLKIPEPNENDYLDSVQIVTTKMIDEVTRRGYETELKNSIKNHIKQYRDSKDPKKEWNKKFNLSVLLNFSFDETWSVNVVFKRLRNTLPDYAFLYQHCLAVFEDLGREQKLLQDADQADLNQREINAHFNYVKDFMASSFFNSSIESMRIEHINNASVWPAPLVFLGLIGLLRTQYGRSEKCFGPYPFPFLDENSRQKVVVSGLRPEAKMRCEWTSAGLVIRFDWQGSWGSPGIRIEIPRCELPIMKSCAQRTLSRLRNASKLVVQFDTILANLLQWKNLLKEYCSLSEIANQTSDPKKKHAADQKSAEILEKVKLYLQNLRPQVEAEYIQELKRVIQEKRKFSEDQSFFEIAQFIQMLLPSWQHTGLNIFNSPEIHEDLRLFRNAQVPPQIVPIPERFKDILQNKQGEFAKYISAQLEMNVEDLEESLLRSSESGYEIYFRRNLPSLSDARYGKYKGSYVFIESQRVLYYIEKNKEKNKEKNIITLVKIDDMDKLWNELNKLRSGKSKLFLYNRQIKALITLNGGHFPETAADQLALVQAKAKEIPSSELIIGRQLGKGATAYVHYATYQRRPVAVKKFIELISQEDIDKEVKMMLRLRHPNIMRLIGISTFNNEVHKERHSSQWFCYLISDYMPKGTLDDVLTSKDSISWRIIHGYAYGIASGLEYLHYNNIVHRDIKPANILVDQHDNVRINDFGTARSRVLTGDAPDTDQFAGTPNWLAPEIFSYSRANIEDLYRESADIYSLAITFWQLLFRCIPYGNITRRLDFYVQNGNRPSLPDRWYDFKLLHNKPNKNEIQADILYLFIGEALWQATDEDQTMISIRILNYMLRDSLQSEIIEGQIQRSDLVPPENFDEIEEKLRNSLRDQSLPTTSLSRNCKKAVIELTSSRTHTSIDTYLQCEDIPEYTPPEGLTLESHLRFTGLIKFCWSPDPMKRPNVQRVIEELANIDPNRMVNRYLM